MGAASRAVLFYGSCLREKQLDGLMLDFYLIVSDYRAAYGKSWLAPANRLIPPNVFYFEHDGLAAKYAVLSEADLHAEAGRKPAAFRSGHGSPSRRGWCGSLTNCARQRTIAIVASAAPTLFQLYAASIARRIAIRAKSGEKAFELTYGAELRAERRGPRRQCRGRLARTLSRFHSAGSGP